MALEDYIPEVAAVGAILRTRTKTVGGQEIGTFNPAAVPEESKTRPTAEQVEEYIDLALTDVADVIGELDGDAACLPKLRTRATGAVAKKAAMYVELSLFSEQVNSGRSPYDQIERDFDRTMKALKEGVSECIGGGGGESVGGAGSLPSYNFDDSPLIGRKTQF